jgi:hypothetical protein
MTGFGGDVLVSICLFLEGDQNPALYHCREGISYFQAKQ